MACISTNRVTRLLPEPVTAFKKTVETDISTSATEITLITGIASATKISRLSVN